MCVVRSRSLRRADIWSRGVLQSVLCLTECDHESSIMRRPWPTGGLLCHGKKDQINVYYHNFTLLIIEAEDDDLDT